MLVQQHGLTGCARHVVDVGNDHAGKRLTIHNEVHIDGLAAALCQRLHDGLLDGRKRRFDVRSALLVAQYSEELSVRWDDRTARKRWDLVIHRRGAVQALRGYPAGQSARRCARAGEAGCRLLDFGIVHTVDEKFQRKADRRRDNERRTGADDSQRCKANVERFLKLVKKYENITELTPAMINEFIDKILVHEPQGKGADRTTEVEIYLNYVGQFQVPVEQHEPTEEERIAAEKEAERLRRKRESNRKYMKKIREKSKEFAEHERIAEEKSSDSNVCVEQNATSKSNRQKVKGEKIA